MLATISRCYVSAMLEFLISVIELRLEDTSQLISLIEFPFK